MTVLLHKTALVNFPMATTVFWVRLWLFGCQSYWGQPRRVNLKFHSIKKCIFIFLACTANNNIKIFTSNLEDEGAITGLSTNSTTKKMFWHQESSCLVLIGSTKHHLHFFDPIDRKQKFALEVISQNVILGEREGEKRYLHYYFNFDVFLSLRRASVRHTTRSLLGCLPK